MGCPIRIQAPGGIVVEFRVPRGSGDVTQHASCFGMLGLDSGDTSRALRQSLVSFQPPSGSPTAFRMTLHATDSSLDEETLAAPEERVLERWVRLGDIGQGVTALELIDADEAEDPKAPHRKGAWVFCG